MSGPSGRLHRHLCALRRQHPGPLRSTATSFGARSERVGGFGDAELCSHLSNLLVRRSLGRLGRRGPSQPPGTAPLGRLEAVAHRSPRCTEEGLVEHFRLVGSVACWINLVISSSLCGADEPESVWSDTG